MGVFHDLAPLCIQAMKDSLFGIVQAIETAIDSDDEEEPSETAVKEEKMGNEAAERHPRVCLRQRPQGESLLHRAGEILHTLWQ